MLENLGASQKPAYLVRFAGLVESSRAKRRHGWQSDAELKPVAVS